MNIGEMFIASLADAHAKKSDIKQNMYSVGTMWAK